MDLLLLFVAVLLGQEVTGLKLLRINVPTYSLRGKSALLECRYDLEADKLYSITWYKDHEEFYRYVPRGEPMKHSYRVEGVKVDPRVCPERTEPRKEGKNRPKEKRRNCDYLCELPGGSAAN